MHDFSLWVSKIFPRTLRVGLIFFEPGTPSPASQTFDAGLEIVEGMHLTTKIRLLFSIIF